MLEGKVAIVTGAGRGVGRAEALELAALGAKVVVNDVGAAVDGSTAGERPAEEVVAEIKKNGGEAVANFSDVADWTQSEQMIRQAIDTFGDLDILINNAGILRDRMIFNMDEADWDLVMRVHLKGHFCTTRHATAYWRDKFKQTGKPVGGRIVNTSSEAFLFGSPGQPNYAAAKGGIIGLTLSVAQSCAKYGITSNAICPRALTRMTEGLFQMDPQLFAPEHVSPLVAFLASPQAERVNGQVFVVYGGQITVVTGPRFDRQFTAADGTFTPKTVAEALLPDYEKREPIVDGFVLQVTNL